LYYDARIHEHQVSKLTSIPSSFIRFNAVFFKLEDKKRGKKEKKRIIKENITQEGKK